MQCLAKVLKKSLPDNVQQNYFLLDNVWQKVKKNFNVQQNYFLILVL